MEPSPQRIFSPHPPMERAGNHRAFWTALKPPASRSRRRRRIRWAPREPTRSRICHRLEPESTAPRADGPPCPRNRSPQGTPCVDPHAHAVCACVTQPLLQTTRISRHRGPGTSPGPLLPGLPSGPARASLPRPRSVASPPLHPRAGCPREAGASVPSRPSVAARWGRRRRSRSCGSVI